MANETTPKTIGELHNAVFDQKPITELTVGELKKLIRDIVEDVVEDTESNILCALP